MAKHENWASGMKEAAAFAPCHITGLFQIFDQSADALHVGSIGAGVSLSLGTRTVVNVKEKARPSVKININNHPARTAQVSKRVVNTFLSRLSGMQKEKCEITVEHHVEMPIGAGFGTSGAAALSLAFALNKAFEVGMSKTEVAQIAHVAEVECKTGLGTVIAEMFGGLEARLKPGAPGVGEIKRIPTSEKTVVACLSFGPLSTRKFLTDKAVHTRINRFGGRLTSEMAANPDAGNFMKLSRDFAEHVGLITEKVRRVLKETDQTGIVCSMPMFGESVFTVTEEENLDQILRVFHEHGSNGQTIISKVDVKGARILQ
jgi:pantoate kinase